MPIKLTEGFPAKVILEKENIFALDSKRARSQDIRPLRLVILNLMPTKIDTEIQLLRLISQSPLQIDVDFLRIATHQHKNTSLHHLNKFYLTFPEIAQKRYDALIVTGAPVEQLAFEEVDYWQELTTIFDWAQEHTTSRLHICWGAQAALYHYHQVAKVPYEKKLFGIFANKAVGHHRLTRGFDDYFYTPQSRYTGIDERALAGCSQLMTIARNPEIGGTMFVSRDHREVYVLGHFEYSTETLKKEYQRDVARGLATEIPENYFQYNYPTNAIKNTWRGHAYLFFHNWLNDVYQVTPYEIEKIGSVLLLPKQADH